MAIRTVSELRKRAAAGETLDFLFLGHRPKHDGGVCKSCLSQWYMAGFELGGTHYASAEHYMMAEKRACSRMPKPAAAYWRRPARPRPRRWGARCVALIPPCGSSVVARW